MSPVKNKWLAPKSGRGRVSPRPPRKLRARTIEKMWAEHSGGFGAFMSSIERDGIAYLSHTKVSTVQRCRQCYYEQFVLKKKAVGPAIETGTLVHEAAQVAYQHIQAGRPVDFDALAQKTAARHSVPSCRALVGNAITTLSQHLWTGHEIVGIEEPFFLDLSADLPPVIGVVDLILRDGPRYLVVDHKTSKRFNDEDEGQLVLYAEYIRQRYGAKRCEGVFDQYRMVPNLARVRTPVHMRKSVKISAKRTDALVPQYRSAWKTMQSIRSAGDAPRGDDCWFCFVPRDKY